MVQATDARHAHDPGRIALAPFDITTGRRVLVRGIVNAILVIVPDVISNQPTQMGLT